MGRSGIHLNNILNILKEVQLKEGSMKTKIRGDISEQSFYLITKFLFEKEFIRYEKDKKDNKSKHVFLTDKGRTFLNLF